MDNPAVVAVEKPLRVFGSEEVDDRRACGTDIVVLRSLDGFLARNCTAEERVRNLELILVRPDEISTFDVGMEGPDCL
jgi:hypothetical protein